MKRKFSVFLVLFVLAFAFFSYSVIKKRYWGNEAEKTKIIIPEKEMSPENALENGEDAAEPDQEEIKLDTSKIKITPKDCDNECSRFKKDEEQKYCEQVCGISDLYDYGDNEDENNNEESHNCEKKSGLEKDYCLKDRAIEDGDMKICEEINDPAIKKTCANRITEDLLEEQQ